MTGTQDSVATAAARAERGPLAAQRGTHVAQRRWETSGQQHTSRRSRGVLGFEILAPFAVNSSGERTVITVTARGGRRLARQRGQMCHTMRKRCTALFARGA